MRLAHARHAAVPMGLLGLILIGSGVVRGAEPYPFEGSWVRADRVCTSAAPSLRTYTARDVTLAGGRCTLRKVTFGSGEWELFEDCRRADHPGTAIEKIRMAGPDTMIVKHQVNRLKIPRGRRFTRCVPPAAKPAAPSPRVPPTPVPGVKPSRPE